MSHPIVVLVSADAEWTPVRRCLAPAHVERSPYGEYFTHAIAGHELVFLHGGWGKIAAAASAEYAIGRWQPRVLINLGTCGGVEGRIERGTKLLVTHATTYDILEAMGDSAEATRAYAVAIDLSWLGAGFPIEVVRSPIVSADRDLVPGQIPDLIARFDAVAGDWESGAIAYVAARRGTRLLIIRGVSDLVGVSGGETIGALDLFRERASEVMRSLVGDLAALVPYLAALTR